MRTVVGLDFDNTLVCYDGLFHTLAAERALLARTIAGDKRSVRDYLRAAGREDAWTELQGVAYGERIGDAEPYPGVREFLARCARRGVDAFVVSHKTERPYAGGDVDLRGAARRWLGDKGFFDAGGALAPERVYFEATRDDKISRIRALGCSHFVDDLADFLAEPALPAGLVRILFDPDGGGDEGAQRDASCLRARSWAEVETLVLGAR
jgi:hypothetical protein